jgi:hypothetical protein
MSDTKTDWPTDRQSKIKVDSAQLPLKVSVFMRLTL